MLVEKADENFKVDEKRKQTRHKKRKKKKRKNTKIMELDGSEVLVAYYFIRNAFKVSSLT